MGGNPVKEEINTDIVINFYQIKMMLNGKGEP